MKHPLTGEIRAQNLQPAVGVCVLTTALVGLAVSVRTWSMVPLQSVRDVVFLALGLVAAVVLAHQFPIHIRHNTKLYVSSVPLYLMAVLLPPPLAALCAGAGLLTSEWGVRKERGSQIGDILTHTGRWIVIVLLGSTIAHWSVPDLPWTSLPLAAAALILWAGDLLTLPLALTPISGQRPSQIIRRTVFEAGAPEGAQYGLGILGGLVAMHYVWTLPLLVVPSGLIYVVWRRQVRPSALHLLAGMADAVDGRTPYTQGHARRVHDLCAGILHELGMRGPESQVILAAARVHDIGRISLTDAILRKEGALTPEERGILEGYPQAGAKLLSRYADYARAVDMVRHHHERWDGLGYPKRLAGADIPFGARVIAVADSFDAMTSDRPYRRALSTKRAAAILADGRGIQWDPDVVDAFLRSIAPRLARIDASPLRLVPPIAADGSTAAAC